MLPVPLWELYETLPTTNQTIRKYRPPTGPERSTTNRISYCGCGRGTTGTCRSAEIAAAQAWRATGLGAAKGIACRKELLYKVL